MSKETFTMTLQWGEMITPHVRHLAFKRDDGEDFPFIPGQFITVHFEHEGKLLRRSYSMATIPGRSNLIEFAASHVEKGLATELLFDLEPGQQLTVNGPHGRLILNDEHPQRYILIATGTGVTPYRTMLPELSKLLDSGSIQEATVLQGVQHQRDLLYAEDFLALAKQQPHFEFRAHYSREDLDGNALEHEYNGYVQKSLGQLNLDPIRDTIYLCGNPYMIDEVFAQLKEQGFDSRQVRREKYISPKTRK